MDGVLKQRIEEWKRIRDDTKRKMNDIADMLDRTHVEHRDVERSNGIRSLGASVIGLCGTLLAPYSGGLSLAAAAAATGTSGYTMWSNYQSNNDLSEKNKKALWEAEAVMKQYDSATYELLTIHRLIASFEEMELATDVRDIVFKLSQKRLEIITANPDPNNLRANIDTSTRSDTKLSYRGAIGSAGCIISKTMSSSAKVIQCTKTTQKIMQSTSVCSQILHSAEAVNKMCNIQPSTFVSSQAMLANFAGARSASSRISTLVLSSKSVNVVSKVGQTTISAATNVQRASKSVKGVSEIALSTDKVIRTTIVSKTVKETSKVFVTATKAASLSKVGVALSVVAIPLNIYNIINIKNKSCLAEEVKRIRDEAYTLGEDILEHYTVTIETFDRMYSEVYKVYENQRVEKLYEFLKLCHEKLDFKIPPD